MNPNIKHGYGIILLLSVLLYGIPFKWGGYPVKFFIALLIVVTGLYIFRQTWKTSVASVRINHLLWLVNSLALFHLVLIYIYLILAPDFTLIIGLVLAFPVYFIVTNHIKNTF